MKIAAEESRRLPHVTGVKIKEEIIEEWEESILPTRNSNEEINVTEVKSLSNDVENSSPLHIRLDIKIEEEKCEESNIENKPEKLQRVPETKRDDKEVKQNIGEVNESLEVQNSESVQDDNADERNEQNMEGNFPSTAEALSCLKTLKQFLSIHEKQELNLQKLSYIENCVNEIAYKAKEETKIKD